MMAFVVNSLTIVFMLVSAVQSSTLYGYGWSGASTNFSLFVIDPASGNGKVVCDLAALPPLSSASGSSKFSMSTSPLGSLLFYSISAAGNISLVSLDPLTCTHNSTIISGLNQGQNLVRDIKYDNINNNLYMVFPNPFCMHGSLDLINPNTGAVVKHLTNVIDPQGLAQTAALSGKSGNYYFVSVPLGDYDDALTYQLSVVSLATGNTSTVNLANNNIDVGDMWGSNYTLNVVVGSDSEYVFGAISSTSDVHECSPSGFYSINPTTGNVTCEYGPIAYEVELVAELDSSTGYYYQVMSSGSTYYLLTYDTTTKALLYEVPCTDVCAGLLVLAAIP